MVVTVVILVIASLAFFCGLLLGLIFAAGKGKTTKEREEEDSAQVSFCKSYERKSATQH